MKKENFIHNNSFINEFKKQKELLQLQKEYESGIIKEMDLSEDEKNNLAKLYKKQIDDLQNDINSYKKSLEIYKEKIISIRNKL